jgi:regulatory protein
MAKKYQNAAFEEVGGLTWEVTFPQGGSSLGGRKPQAKLVVAGETLYLPKTVARNLVEARASFEIATSSCEALFEVIDSLMDACCKQQALELLARRDFASQELIQKLALYGYSKACAQSTCAWLEGHNFLHDERYAEHFIEQQVARGKGASRIARELAHKGIDVTALEGWPGAYVSKDDERARALELLKCKSVPQKNPYPKLVRFLVSKGYELSLAKGCVSEYLEQEAEQF